MRWVSTRVLPEPAPATISSGVPLWVTAARCGSLSPSSSASGSRPAPAVRGAPAVGPRQAPASGRRLGAARPRRGWEVRREHASHGESMPPVRHRHRRAAPPADSRSDCSRDFGVMSPGRASAIDTRRAMPTNQSSPGRDASPGRDMTTSMELDSRRTRLGGCCVTSPRPPSRWPSWPHRPAGRTSASAPPTRPALDADDARVDRDSYGEAPHGGTAKGNLLSFNDFHGAIDPPTGSGGAGQRHPGRRRRVPRHLAQEAARRGARPRTARRSPSAPAT